MSQYFSGYVTTENGSDIIRGIGTKFVENIKRDDLLFVKISPEEVLGPFLVDRVMQDTLLYISESFPGPTLFRVKYAITRNFTTNFQIPNVSLGDEVIAKSIIEGMEMIENILETGESGVENSEYLSSVSFEYNEYFMEMNTYIYCKLIGQPGSIRGDDFLFERCEIGFADLDYSDYLTMLWSYRGECCIQSKGVAFPYNFIYLKATFADRPDLQATCGISIRDVEPVIPLTSFNQLTNIDVPYDSSCIIRPEILPDNADNALFNLELFASYFYNYFSVSSNMGRQVEIKGLKNYEGFTSSCKLIHYPGTGQTACPSKTLSFLNTKYALPINSMKFATNNLDFDLFGRVELDLIFDPTTWDASTWSADYNTSVYASFLWEYGKVSSLILVNCHFDSVNKKVVVDFKIRDTSPVGINTSGECNVSIIAKNLKTGISDTCVIRCKYKACTDITCDVTAITLLVGETRKINALPSPLDASHKNIETSMSIAGIIDLLDFNLLNQYTNKCYTNGTSIIIKGLIAGSSVLTLSPQEDIYGNGVSITVNVVEGVTAIPITGIELRQRYSPTSWGPMTNGIGVKQSMIIDAAITPTNASIKSIRLSTTTPERTSFVQEHHNVTSGSVIPFKLITGQYGPADITVTAEDGSGISIMVPFNVGGTNPVINATSLGFKMDPVVDLISGISITPRIETQAGMFLGEKIVDIHGFIDLEGRSEYFLKILVEMLPSDATYKDVTYEVEGKNIVVMPRTGEVYNSLNLSTNDYCYVKKITTFPHYGEDYCKVIVRGVDNNFYDEIYLRF